MKKTYLIAISAMILLLSQAAKPATVDVDLNTTHQGIRGFGGMNFPRWIGTLTDAQVDTAFGNGPEQIGLTIMRIDVPPSTSNWSGAVASAQRAQNNHGALVFASPWSPPASMKTNNNVNDGGELKTDSYGAYAAHLSDFVNYMATNGVSLYAISVQNEPDVDVSYESCDWTPTQMLNFLANNASVIPTRVMAAESYHFDQSFTDPILNNPSAEAQVDIVAGHIYGGGLADYPLARSKGKEIWMTEHYTTSNVSANLWPEALGVGEEIHNCMAANMNAYIWWYIRRSYGPIDESGNITKRGYCMSHFAKFVRPGYTRVDATDNPSPGVYVTAYQSDGNLVIVAVNQNSSSSDVTFSLSGGVVSSYTRYETAGDVNFINRGSVGNTNTLAAYSINTFVGTISFEDDNTPPTPDPMTWASEPVSTGENSIEMTATTATDISGVEYYFDCLTAGGHDSGWQDDAYYEDTGLDPDTQYYYRVQARDKSPAHNQTDWSSEESATTDPPDEDPPTPDPMTWSVVPTATGATTITMTATTASDISGVEYYFDCLTTGGHDSGWQDSSTYIDSVLTPSTSYTYRVQARDKSPAQNTTDWSSSLAATTEAPPTDIEIIGSWAAGTTHAKQTGYNRGLVFIAHAEDDVTLTLNSVTYGGQAMTKIIDRTTGASGYRAYVAAYILSETGIAAATTNDFVTSWSAGAEPENISYGSVFLQNVDQATPIGATASNSSTSSTPNPITTSALSTADGDMVIDAAACGNAGDYTLQNGFTEALEHDMSSSTGVDGYKAATGAPETPSAQHSSANRQAIIGFVVQAGSQENPPPAAPTGLNATEGNNTVSLDWNNNSEPDLAGYNVYRSTDSGSGYAKINGTLVISSDYIDNTVTNGITYYYVVTAVDTLSQESDSSDEASATPTLVIENCADVQSAGFGLLSDLTGDCYIDELDLAVLTDYWLSSDCAGIDDCDGSDFEPDGDVDFADFADFALLWLECNDPENPDCTPNWL